jgi:hypothetical protein
MNKITVQVLTHKDGVIGARYVIRGLFVESSITEAQLADANAKQVLVGDLSTAVADLVRAAVQEEFPQIVEALHGPAESWDG